MFALPVFLIASRLQSMQQPVINADFRDAFVSESDSIFKSFTYPEKVDSKPSFFFDLSKTVMTVGSSQ